MSSQVVVVEGVKYYPTSTDIRVGTVRSKVDHVSMVYATLPKGKRRKLRKALRAIGDKRCSLPAALPTPVVGNRY